MTLSYTHEPFPTRPRIIFMGTPDFAVPTLEALIRNGYRPLGVVTQPDRPKGRGKKPFPSSVKIASTESGIEVLQPEKASDPAFLNLIRDKSPDLIIVIAFGQILRKNLLEIPKWGVINIHASLLPRYRGAAPIQWAILNDEEKTGLTIMQMNEGLDTGPILFQEEVRIEKGESAGSLRERLAKKAGESMVDFLKRHDGRTIEGNLQDDSAATYAPKIEREMALIDWKQPASRISALIRALDPKPGAYTLFQKNEMKLFSPRILNGKNGLLPGQVRGTADELLIGAGLGILAAGEVQVSGKKRMAASAFLRGFSFPAGTILGE